MAELCCANLSELTIAGRWTFAIFFCWLPSSTKENHATMLAAVVKATAAPTAKYSFAAKPNKFSIDFFFW